MNMTLTQNGVTYSNREELAEAIISITRTVAEKRASRISNNRNVRHTVAKELESFVIFKVYDNGILDKPHLHNVAGVTNAVNLWSRNFFKHESRFSSMHPNFSNFESENEDGEVESIVYVVESSQNVEKMVTDRDTLERFMDILTPRQHEILTLISEGYGNNEICELLDVSINTPKNTMKTIRTLAENFGLSLM